MSLKLYLLDRFGVLKRTKKIDRQRSAMWDSFQQFLQLKETDEFIHFLKLEEEVNSAEFAEKRTAITSLKYKGSKEQLKVSEYEKLSKGGKLAHYYKVVATDDFKRFKELDMSYLIKEFKLVKSYVEKEYEADKKHFEEQNADGSLNWEQSKPCQNYRSYEETLNTEDVQFWLNYQKSKDYGVYKESVNSPDRVRVEELKREVESEDFKSRREFLENPNRWEKTPEYARLREYEHLCAEPRYVDYVKFRNDEYFQFFMQHKVLMHDKFKGEKLDEDAWLQMSSYAAQHAGFSFSHESDLQGYTAGKNAEIDHETLCINTKKEDVEAFVWKKGLGFIPYSYQYSSGAVSHKKPISTKRGVLEARVKYYSTKRLVDLFYLGNADETFRLNLLEMGVHTQVGYQDRTESMQESIKGLRQGKYYIFRVEWGDNRVSWWVNNRKLLDVKLDLPEEDLYINIRTIVVGEKPKAPHMFQVDWMTIFSK